MTGFYAHLPHRRELYNVSELGVTRTLVLLCSLFQSSPARSRLSPEDCLDGLSSYTRQLVQSGIARIYVLLVF